MVPVPFVGLSWQDCASARARGRAATVGMADGGKLGSSERANVGNVGNMHVSSVSSRETADT